MYGWKMRDEAGMESQMPHFVMYIPHCRVMGRISYVAVFLHDYAVE